MCKLKKNESGVTKSCPLHSNYLGVYFRFRSPKEVVYRPCGDQPKIIVFNWSPLPVCVHRTQNSCTNIMNDSLPECPMVLMVTIVAGHHSLSCVHSTHQNTNIDAYKPFWRCCRPGSDQREEFVVTHPTSQYPYNDKY